MDYFQREFVLGGTGWIGYGTVNLVNQSVLNAAGQTTNLSSTALDNALSSSGQASGSFQAKIYSAYISDVVNILPNLSAMLSMRVDHFTGKSTSYSTEESKATTTFSPKIRSCLSADPGQSCIICQLHEWFSEC